jgi:hypothetical protein
MFFERVLSAKRAWFLRSKRAKREILNEPAGASEESEKNIAAECLKY